jgi:hypothetical protein
MPLIGKSKTLSNRMDITIYLIIILDGKKILIFEKIEDSQYSNQFHNG